MLHHDTSIYARQMAEAHKATFKVSYSHKPSLQKQDRFMLASSES